MGKLILIRHGATVWNLEGRFQGQKNIPLTDAGISQAQELAEKLSSISIEAIFASDLDRAKHTAEIIAKPHKLKVHEDLRLREYNFGVWEGLTRSEILTRYEDVFNQRRVDIDAQIPMGETARQVQERVSKWLRDLSAQYQGTVVAVSHGGAIRALLSVVLDIPVTKMHPVRLDNCSVNIIQWDEKDHHDYQLVTVNNLL